MNTNEAIVPAASGLAIPVRSIGKGEIETRVDTFLLDALELLPAPELYTYLKQIEYAVESARAKLKVRAATETAERFASSKGKGLVLGHEISLVTRQDWIFSLALDNLKEQHKLEVDALKAEEKANGKARKDAPKDPEIRITLKP